MYARALCSSFSLPIRHQLEQTRVYFVTKREKEYMPRGWPYGPMLGRVERKGLSHLAHHAGFMYKLAKGGRSLAGVGMWGGPCHKKCKIVRRAPVSHTPYIRSVQRRLSSCSLSSGRRSWCRHMPLRQLTKKKMCTCLQLIY